MNKKDYQLFAEVVAKIDNKEQRDKTILFLYDIFLKDNPKFDINKFREFIRRRRNNESLKGLNVNPKYLYN